MYHRIFITSAVLLTVIGFAGFPAKSTTDGVGSDRKNSSRNRLDLAIQILQSYDLSVPREWIDGIQNRHPVFELETGIPANQVTDAQWHVADFDEPVSIAHGDLTFVVNAAAVAFPYEIHRFSASNKKSFDWTCSVTAIGDRHRFCGPLWHHVSVVFSPSDKYFAVFGMTLHDDFYVQVFSIEEGWPHFHVFFSTWDDLEE